MATIAQGIEEIMQLLDTAVSSISNVEQVHIVQILGNADEVIHALSKGCEKPPVDLLVEHLLKSQLRRQAGRLRGLKRSLQTVVGRIENLQQQIIQQERK